MHRILAVLTGVALTLASIATVPTYSLAAAAPTSNDPQSVSLKDLKASIQQNLKQGNIKRVTVDKQPTYTRSVYETTRAIPNYGKLRFALTDPKYSDRASTRIGSDYFTVILNRNDQKLLRGGTVSFVGLLTAGAAASLVSGPLAWVTAATIGTASYFAIQWVTTHGICPVSKPNLYITMFWDKRTTQGCGS